ncbi:PucR family transcriptional regulator [Nocardia fluminea]|uniref:PucR family transcriptional regulator n=1 Tax=Nocardia fluminea TaxID=134984 RepID=UPI00364F28E6
MLTIDENLCTPVHSEGSTTAAALNEFAMSLLSGGHINLSVARHFQIPAAGSFVVVATAFSSPDVATTDRPTVVPDAWLADIRRCLAAECGFPVPALLGPTHATILIPGSSVLGRRIGDIHPLLCAAARHAITAVAIESENESISAAAETAHELLDVAIRLRKKSRLYSMDQLALEYQITRPGPGRDRLVSVLEPLEEYPELIQTLAEFVSQGFDRQRSARRLCVHVNTIDYRMRRISSLTGLPVSHGTRWRLFAALTARAFVRGEHCQRGSADIPAVADGPEY